MIDLWRLATFAKEIPFRDQISKIGGERSLIFLFILFSLLFYVLLILLTYLNLQNGFLNLQRLDSMIRDDMSHFSKAFMVLS